MDTVKWIFYVFLMIKTTESDWLNCIPECNCKWSSGKKTAFCINAGLESIPHLASDIQTLDLHGNPIKSLEKDAFAKIDLLNLQRLNLSATQLQYLHQDAFNELMILIELDLSQNDLTQILPNTFKGNDRLRLLVLNDNPLGALVAEQFPALIHLKKIELSRCRLKKIHPAAFVNLRSLESVFLHQNFLTYLHQDAFNIPFLKTLTLTDNPWYCDCRIRSFHEWWLQNNLGREEVVCNGPEHLAQISWRHIKSSEIYCPVSASVYPGVIRTENGADVSFSCFAQGDPKPKVTWHHHQNEIYNSSEFSEVLVHRSHGSEFDEYKHDFVNKSAQWVNITITNITIDLSGEWQCNAKSKINEEKASVIIVMPKARTATARVPPNYSTFLLVAAAMLAMTGVGFIATFVCWKTRRRRVPPSRSFTDQEKKLLDTSIAVSYDRTSGELGSSYGFEMIDRSISIDSEGTPRMEPMQITIEGPPGLFPPPPAEFALPAPYGNIFISVQVSGQNEKYPDLLGGGATLPRRSRTCLIRAPYDNMGPRITAAGSSTWSLPGPNVEKSEDRSKTPLTMPFSTFSTDFTAL